jgi:hypothetical protein
VSLPARVTTLIVAFVAVVAGVWFVVAHFLLAGPPTEDFTAGVTPNTGQTIHVMLQEDAQNTVSQRPDWVSYFIRSPSGQWVHTTLFKVPAGTRVDMTILGYDGCTPARNPYFGLVTGTIGNIALVDGKPVKQLNSWSGCNVGHTFSIPGINLNVPMDTPAVTASLCSTSPCTSGPHKTMQFSFMTPKASGVYFWQCRIPCGGGFVTGFGGPMQTIGYMTGNMTVVS